MLVKLTVVLGLLMVAGCSADEPSQFKSAREYFSNNNAAAARGSQAQQDFFRQTQHPDFTGETCVLGDITVDLDPALSTLRPDPRFAPDGGRPPRGEVWVVGVEVTTRRAGAIVGHQIGSQHLVLLGDKTYGFAPCPS